MKKTIKSKFFIKTFATTQLFPYNRRIKIFNRNFMIDLKQVAALQEMKNKIIKEKIYDLIQTNKTLSFEDLLKHTIAQDITSSKQELSQFLRILESEKNVFQVSGSYYDLHGFADIEGYPQWNLNGFCWLETQDLSSEYGITLNANDNLLTVFNKRDIGHGFFVKGKKIDLEERSFVYVTESTPTYNKKIIGTVDVEKNKVFSLNSNTGYSFVIPQGHTFTQDEVVVFNSLDFSVVERLGHKNDKGIEDKIISLLSELKEAPESEMNNNIRNNTKLDKLFYTIDSPYTSDIDDAIATEVLKDKNEFKIYVAIADVSSYVKPGDEQDLHAQEQSSSFYLANRTIHMLSKQLATTYCSLNVGENRSSMVCELTYDLDTKNFISSNFYQAEIQSKARLTYDDVDRMMNGVNPQESFLFKNNVVEKFINLEQSKEVIESLNNLRDFTEKHKTTNERDYWVVEMPEFVLGEDGKIDHLKYRDENQLSQKMVETSMLAANIAAAEFLNKNFPDAGLFRNQTAPEDGKRPKPATYSIENLGHWGLQKPSYTHFTSPIRRYPDLLVHRFIKSVISPESNDKLSKEQVTKNVEQVNFQAYKAKQNDMKAYNLLLAQYVEKLVKTNTLDKKVEFVDFSENGVVLKNSQHIEFFVPTFKLENYVTRVLNKLLPKPEEVKELTIEEKKAGLEKLNSTWDIFLQISPYSWTDERKNVLYQFSRKENSLNMESRKPNR